MRSSTLLEILSFFTASYVFVSPSDVPVYKSLFPFNSIPSTQILNGIDDFFDPTVSRDPCYDCLMLARVNPQKDHNTLIKALSLNNFSLAFAGPSTDNSSFIDYCLTNLSDTNKGSVAFLGSVSDTPSLLSSSKIFVLSSF